MAAKKKKVKAGKPVRAHRLKKAAKSRAVKARWLSDSALMARRETFDSSEKRDSAFERPAHREIELPKSSAEITIEKKKSMPHAVIAVLSSAALTAAVGAAFLLAMGLEPIITLGVLLPLFVGFSILFYNFQEGKQ